MYVALAALLEELFSDATEDELLASAELVSDAASEEDEGVSSAAELTVSESELAGPAASVEESGSGVSASGA